MGGKSSSTASASNMNEANEPASTINRGFLNKLRWMGFIEGTSTLVLFFVAMPLKYLANKPIAVEIAGSLHGGLFVCLVLMLVIAVWRVPISIGMSLAGMVSAVIPFGPFVYDRWLRDVDGSTSA